MKAIPYLAVLTAATALVLGSGTARAEEGIALAIIFDTSGSMKDPVPDKAGGATPKYIIARKALAAVAGQIEAYATNSPGGAPRNVQAGLFIFQNNDRAREAIKFGPFKAEEFRRWAERFNNPNGNTPLGNTLNSAGRAVLDSPLNHKHVLVITDGINTAGPPPQSVLPRLKELAAAKQTGFSVHFIAFDVDDKVFTAVKKQGATVVGAADEKQLNSQLDFILQRKILLEDEEPKKP